MTKIILSILCVFLFSGCSIGRNITEPKPEPIIEVVNSIAYINRPDVPECDLPKLQLWQWLAVRDTAQNASKYGCHQKEDEARTEYEKRCFEHPIIPDTNVLYGVDVQGFNTIQMNFKLLQQALVTCAKKVEEVNKQRAEDRLKSAKEAERVKEKLQELDSD